MIIYKFQPDNNILASLEASQYNCLSYVQRLCRFPLSQEYKILNRSEMKNKKRYLKNTGNE